MKVYPCCYWCLVAKSCPAVTRTIHGISPDKKENWSGLPFPSPGESSWPGDQTCVSHLAGIFFITESPGKPKVCPRCSIVIESRIAPYHRGWHSSWQLMVFLDYSTTFIEHLLLARPILDLMQNPASIHWHQIKFWRQSFGWSRKEWASLVAQRIHLPRQETWVRSLGREDSLEEGMATHFNILAWRIPWTEEPGWL